MRTTRPILVTGSHRSGTTWVGRMLASSPSVGYIHEPFHIHHDPKVCEAHFERWFTYVCGENEAQYRGPVDEMLARVARREVRPLVKDPIAVFSAGWLASRFETVNVVMIRHPAAFAGSLKEKRWDHPFSHFLEQPLLMRDHLAPFAGDIMRFARVKMDILDQAALLWNLIHQVILDYRRAHPEWIYLRHEDLSRNPLDGFRALFDCLGLEFTDRSAEVVMAHSYPGPADGGVQDLKRDSRANIDTWRRRLTPGEVTRLKSRVHEISRHFYSDDEW